MFLLKLLPTVESIDTSDLYDLLAKLVGNVGLVGLGCRPKCELVAAVFYRLNKPLNGIQYK